MKIRSIRVHSSIPVDDTSFARIDWLKPGGGSGQAWMLVRCEEWVLGGYQV
ncbi:hypothetical protein [Syntrophothermus lipocalidus]|uniref:hypothetical protein n=1 Tax=Syntrophothermus lipocalidus TaxID=86170 RepID=UPI00145E906E